jgi:hypothetical protein
MTTVESFLSGGGAPTAKFPTKGVTIKGTIEDLAVTQQTDLNGNPLEWDDGNPRMQLVVTLATDERDAAIDDDDGKRRLFVKGGMRTAVKDALKLAGAKTLEVGGTLAVQYKDDGEPPRAGFNAPKIYVAQYKAPAADAVSVDELI